MRARRPLEGVYTRVSSEPVEAEGPVVRVRQLGRVPRSPADRRHWSHLAGGILHVTVQDLRHRLRRFVVAVAGTAVVLTLLFLMTGLAAQFKREALVTTETIGASHWVVPEAVRGPFTSSTRFTPEQVQALVSAGGAPVSLGRLQYSFGDRVSDVHFVVHGAGLGTPPVFAGRVATGPGELAASEDADFPLGSTVRLGTVDFEVVGLVRETTILAGVPVVFLPASGLQGLIATPEEVVSAVLFDGAPASLPSGAVVHTSVEIAEATREPLDQAIQTIDLMRILLTVVAVMIISTVTYLSTIDRQRDVAVLRAMGASPSTLGATVAIQAIVLALVAAFAAMVLQTVVAPVFPMRVHLTTSDHVLLPVYAATIAMVAAYGAIRRTLRIDPASAFGGPGG